MLNINTEEMLTTAGAAYDAVVESVKSETLAKRWVNAIARAVQLFETNAHFMTMRQDGALVIFSPESFEVYEVTKEGCHCKAAKKHQPCKHAAARKLYCNYVSRTSH